ncbi:MULTISPECIES: NAD-dependent epimerase/dehydratase family protein [Microbacterium]|uniref:NAD-dependent epimerase/dehydratase family protein n=1 Tax=Microbacterium TaxID=33882 RepID=UPI002783D7F8|nr:MULTISPECIES: NAD-dependent epimerase/dehydratase family protein [Microbacterium]MDQ1084862.1 2'-hydroxyisoflavone reductase [Microbacterium sp. SORGH_AS_0344]MDQ1169858.1 2'-hydroxyisoflavone reductase [Microbacterium proteolyticum]
MRRVLILGGTAWLGRAIARAAVARGAEVTCLARGEGGGVSPGSRLVRADRRDPRAYDALDGDWDDVVEVSWDPGFVASALDALARRAAHWTLVSSVSVYARADVPFADETADLVEPTDLDQYADAKVHAERLTTARVGDRALLARAGLIVGPGDPTDRFGYWPARFARGGRVLTPRTADRSVQGIDVDDLADWIERAGRNGITGPVNAVGEELPLAAVLTSARDAAGTESETVALDDDTLLARGVQHWMGPRSLPLWLPPEAHGFSRRSDAAFVASGGRRRPLSETMRRTLDDERARGLDRARRAGLTLDEEAEVLGR